MSSEIDQLREELAQAADAIEQRDSMLAIVAHELRNPISPVMMSLDVLALEVRDMPLDRDAILRRVAQARRYVERLRTDLDRLLDFSRLRTGRIDLQLAEVDLSALVVEELRDLEPQLRASECELRLTLEEPLKGHWDRMRLRQVIWNLVSNAGKYAAGALVEISTRGDDKSAWLVVRDHGPGIAASEHQAVFKQFERVKSSSHTGFGVGLWLVKQIVEALGGTIDLESAVGQGSTFTVTLPRTAP
ncbi:MAG: HAMP domain-containing histidine kinase [Kofleriaceae bacterium]|nr:HAMP domain-containing histidine kinase [Kofleriaceae bacterium]